ncbi:MAG: hypothetical protein KJ949_01410 [Nanoarchaeota archaeon]|nr:hypothetical protein [Nanoarchaeota archaeon]MBU4308767.1 hypothetical protein [Nanoarchaeota archaeon]
MGGEVSKILMRKYYEGNLHRSTTLKTFQMPPREDDLEIIRKFLDVNAVKVGDGNYVGDFGKGIIKILDETGTVIETDCVYFKNSEVREKYNELRGNLN